MKLKTLSCAIFAAFTLTACGGGSDGGSSDPVVDVGTTNKFQQWSNFSIENNYSTDKIGYDSDTITIDQNKAYSKNTNTLNWDENKTFFVTADGEYDEGEEHPKYGAYQGEVSISNNIWTHIPYSNIGSKGLKLTVKYNPVDISNRTIAPLVSFHEYWVVKHNQNDNWDISDNVINFIQAIEQVKFPQGSACLQLVESSNNQEYLELYKNQDTPELQTTLKQDWESYRTNTSSDIHKKVFKDTIAYLEYDEDNAEYSGVAQKANHFYEVNLTQKGVEFSKAQEITLLESLAAEYLGADQTIARDYINLYKNSCSMFNQTASEAIKKQIANFQ
ncbi:hypothetical protein [Acinetobacter towneri]|uniref:Lipoprotein n=1 Tax=Acinetobacter towneri TaxID=202956 RepID=A0AAP9KIV9_9GAMM|nr:hypothetical protein [Acinetobacter towneri]QGM27328.1 hypothetical protein GJD93_06395 [Acinetobacter towneri]